MFFQISGGKLKQISTCPGEHGQLRCVTCRYGQRGKGPGEEWSYSSKRGRDGEKAKERDSSDYPAPVLAYYPPGIQMNVYRHSIHTMYTHSVYSQMTLRGWINCITETFLLAFKVSVCVCVYLCACECMRYLWVNGRLYLFVQWAGRSWLSCTLGGNGRESFWEIIFIFVVADEQ